MLFQQNISNFLSNLQLNLFDRLDDIMPSRLNQEHKRVIEVLEIIRIEDLIPVPVSSPLGGCPAKDRRKLARAFIIRTVLGLSTAKDLIHHLQVDRVLRRICGWNEGERLPSKSTFSRAFNDCANLNLFDKVHAYLVSKYLDDTITEHVSYDSTAIPVRERVVKHEEEVPKVHKYKRGRPKRGEERPSSGPTRVKCQSTQTIDEMLTDLPKVCGIGCKKNSHGDNEYWIGYKLHVALTDDGLPVAAFTTSANMHDSGGGIPLLKLTGERIKSCYDLMDSAYDVEDIRAVSRDLGHVPIIDTNMRTTGKKAEKNALSKLPYSRLNIDRTLVETDRRRRFKVRTSVERFNSRIKDYTGIRMIRMRGHPKVHSLLMCGLLVVFAEVLISLGR
jgi:hypothetical protein